MTQPKVYKCLDCGAGSMYSTCVNCGSKNTYVVDNHRKPVDKNRYHDKGDWRRDNREGHVREK